MKKIVIILLLFSCLPNLKAKRIPALLINKQDSLNITLLVPINKLYDEVNFEKLTRNPRMLDSLSNKPVGLELSSFQELHFHYKKKPIRLVSMPNSELFSDTTSGFTLLELKVDGRMRFYYHYEERRETGDFDENSKWVNGIQIKKIDPKTGDVVHDNPKNVKSVVKSPLIQVGNERPVRFFKGSRKRWIVYCINDCEALMNLISQRKHKIKEHKLELTVKKYNDLCGD